MSTTSEYWTEDASTTEEYRSTTKEFQEKNFLGLTKSSLAYRNAVFSQTSSSKDQEPHSFPEEFHIKIEKKENCLDIEYSFEKYEEIWLSFQILMNHQLTLHSLKTYNYKITKDALNYDFLGLLKSHDEIVPILKIEPIDEPSIANDNQRNNTGSVLSQTAEIHPNQAGTTDIISVTHILNNMSRQMKIFESRVKLEKSKYRGQLAEDKSSAENQQIIRTIIQFIQNCKGFFHRVFPDFPIADLDDYESALCGVMKHFSGESDCLALIDRSIGVIVGIIQEIQVEYNLHQLTYVDEKPNPVTESHDSKNEYDTQKQEHSNTKMNHSNKLLKNDGQDWLKFYVDMTTNPFYSGEKKIVAAVVDTGSRYTLIPQQWVEFSYFEDEREKITQKFTGVGGKTLKIYENFVTVDVKLEYFAETTIRFEEAVLVQDQRRKYIIVGRKDLQKFGFFCDFGFDTFGFKALGNLGVTATFPIQHKLNYCDTPRKKRLKSA